MKKKYSKPKIQEVPLPGAEGQAGPLGICSNGPSPAGSETDCSTGTLANFSCNGGLGRGFDCADGSNF